MCEHNIYLYTQTNTRTYDNQAGRFPLPPVTWHGLRHSLHTECFLHGHIYRFFLGESRSKALLKATLGFTLSTSQLFSKVYLRQANKQARQKRSQLSLEIQFSMYDLDEEGLFFFLRLFLKRPAGSRFISQFQCVLLCSQLSLHYLATFLGYLT